MTARDGSDYLDPHETGTQLRPGIVFVLDVDRELRSESRGGVGGCSIKRRTDAVRAASVVAAKECVPQWKIASRFGRSITPLHSGTPRRCGSPCAAF